MNSFVVEDEIQAKGLNAPRITPEMVEAQIAGEHYFTAQEGVNGAAHSAQCGAPQDQPLALLTFCVLTMRNGFTVTGESACASPENFDAELGRKIARRAAVSKVWPMMGYELRSRLHAAENAAQPQVGASTSATASILQMSKVDRIARICHEVNRAYCEALGDHSQPAWEDAPEWQRESARMGVDLHLMGDFGAEASHMSWMKQKLDDGWTYGEVKDAEKKQHPCLVPFEQLPREQQAKDYIFRGVVHAMK